MQHCSCPLVIALLNHEGYVTCSLQTHHYLGAVATQLSPTSYQYFTNKLDMFWKKNIAHQNGSQCCWSKSFGRNFCKLFRLWPVNTSLSTDTGYGYSLQTILAMVDIWIACNPLVICRKEWINLYLFQSPCHLQPTLCLAQVWDSILFFFVYSTKLQNSSHCYNQQH